MPTNTPTLTLTSGQVGSIVANTKPRFISVNNDVNIGFGTTEPTTWSSLDYTNNNFLNVSDDMGTMWFWNNYSNTVVINCHYGA